MKPLKIVFGIICAFATMGCSMEASIKPAGEAPSSAPSPFVRRTERDFVSGETRVTANGTTIRATFGEVASRQISNGHVIEGVVQW